MYVKTCIIFYQKNKYKVFYKNITTDCLSYPTISPPFSYFTHPLSHLPKLVTTPIGDATLRSTPLAPFTTLRLHSVVTLRLHSGGITIRSWPIFSSEKSRRGGWGEPCHHRSLLGSGFTRNAVAKISDLESVRVSGVFFFFFPSQSRFLGWLGGCGGWLGGFVDRLWWLAGFCWFFLSNLWFRWLI